MRPPLPSRPRLLGAPAPSTALSPRGAVDGSAPRSAAREGAAVRSSHERRRSASPVGVAILFVALLSGSLATAWNVAARPPTPSSVATIAADLAAALDRLPADGVIGVVVVLRDQVDARAVRPGPGERAGAAVVRSFKDRAARTQGGLRATIEVARSRGEALRVTPASGSSTPSP